MAVALDEHQTSEKGHGRRETRTYVIIPAPATVDPDDVWRDRNAVGMAITESVDSQGRGRLEARYYILSVLLPANPTSAAREQRIRNSRGFLLSHTRSWHYIGDTPLGTLNRWGRVKPRWSSRIFWAFSG